ncbi:MAG: hypothetical protein H7124_13055 [Phycisphaerales bacterium]|nr:hypothetical protein [Hyphomonadaceae bacterium]
MRKTALLAAASALFVTTPALAQSGGHVGVNLSTTETESSEGDTWQIDAAFGGASGAVGYQIDGAFGNSDFGSGSDVDQNTLAGHLYWNGEGWRLGGVIAQTNFDAGSGISAEETAYGVEGTFNLGANAVLLGSYTIGEAEIISEVDTSNVDLGLNYYFADNFRAGVSAGAGSLDTGIAEIDTSSFGVSAEWQPWTTPVSFGVSYDTFSVDDVFGDFNTLMIGARYNWGGSLRERDNATPFDTRTGFFQRWYGIQ